MEDSEKIRGEKIFDMLEQLKKNHTILNMHVLGTDFDGLSIILGLSDGENPRFFIDYPVKAGSDTPISVGKRCYFEFSDEIKIKYSFESTINSVFGKRIKFNLPEFIERSQRRKAFRISPPSNSRLLYADRDNQFQFDIINVSEGGLLVCIGEKYHRADILFKGNTLGNLILSSEMDNMPIDIRIRSAEIIRLDKRKEGRIFIYGFKFTEIDKTEKNKLTNFIYYCQRRELKKRKGPYI